MISSSIQVSWHVSWGGIVKVDYSGTRWEAVIPESEAE
jgi:hypothetical protein